MLKLAFIQQFVALMDCHELMFISSHSSKCSGLFSFDDLYDVESSLLLHFYPDNITKAFRVIGGSVISCSSE